MTIPIHRLEVRCGEDCFREVQRLVTGLPAGSELITVYRKYDGSYIALQWEVRDWITGIDGLVSVHAPYSIVNSTTAEEAIASLEAERDAQQEYWASRAYAEV